MGRVQVRAAITNQLQNAALPYVGTVFPGRPQILQEEAYTQTMNSYVVQQSESGSSCAIVVNMPDDIRQREALVGRPFVNDLEKHSMVLELFFASGGGEGIAAQLDYDTIVDAIFVNIRANPTPGGGDVVWSAAEFRPWIRHNMAQPYTTEDGLTILINGAIRYEAFEWLAGSGI